MPLLSSSQVEQQNSKLGKLFEQFSDTFSRNFLKDLILRTPSIDRSFHRNDSSINEDASKEKITVEDQG